MKAHVIIKLKEGVPAPDVPYWVDDIHVQSPTATSLHPAVDSVLRHFQLPVQITREFAPQEKNQWSKEETESGLNRIYRLILTRNTRIPPDLIQSITLIPEVEYAQAGAVGLSPMPDVRPIQMGRTTGLRSRELIHLPEAHRITRGDASITIAVLDTGVSLKHPEYRSVLLDGYDFVDIIDGAEKFIGDFVDADPISADRWVGHGSHVTGIIAAAGMRMPAGIVPKCKILPVRVLGAMKQGNRLVGAGLIDNINAGVKFAVDRGADVINMSLGVRREGGGLPHQEVVDYARKKGVSIVAASGNDGSDMVYYPGGHPYVITVGAVDETGQVAQFSTYGNHVDFVAPGTDIYSTYLGNRYAFSSGTSHAAPSVSGAVAMLLSYARDQGRKLTDSQVKYILKRSADKVGRRFKDFKAGYGMLNLIDALTLLDHKLNVN